jgi:hypothetical protein
MKTSGFREIDFSKTECKNCGENSAFKTSTVFVPKGMFLELEMLGLRLVDCPVCKGTGYLNENSETELELE